MDGRTDGRMASHRIASHRCVLNRRTWSVHNRLGVTRASAGAGHSGLCLPTNVGVTEYLLSARSIHARGEGRRARMYVYARSQTILRFGVVVITGTAARCVRNVMQNYALRNLPARADAPRESTHRTDHLYR